MICKYCGKEIDDNLSVCPECGQDIADEEVENTHEAEETAVETVEQAAEDLIDETEEAAAEIPADDLTDDVPSATVIPYDPNDGAEYSEDDAEAFIDSAVENIQPKKKSPVLKIIATIIILLIAAAVCFFGYNALNGSDDVPFIYMANENGTHNVYAYFGGDTSTLLTASKDGNYSENQDFVAGKKNIYFMSDGTLNVYTKGSKSATKIADAADAGSVVMSGDENSVLYTVSNEDLTSYELYYYKKGSSPKKITDFAVAKTDAIYPSYGFSRSSNDYWYIGDTVKDAELGNGNLYVKKGSTAEIYAENVYAVQYFDIDSQLLVYTSEAFGEVSVEQPADGEETAEQPEAEVITSAYIKEGKNEPEKIIDKYFMNQIIAVDSPSKGIVYTVEQKVSDEEFSVQPIYDIYFKPVGGEKQLIDTDSLYAYNAQSLIGTLYNPYNYGSDATTADIILYIKDSKLYLTSNGLPGQYSEGMDFTQSAPPAFTDKADAFCYTTPEGKLIYNTYINDTIGTPVTIAEQAAVYAIDGTGSQIAYVVLSDDAGSSSTAGTLYVYDIKSGATTEIAHNVYPLVYFSVDDSTIYYISNFSSETQTADICVYKNGKSTTVDVGVSNFLTSNAGTPYIIRMSEESNSSTAAMYTFDKSYNIIKISDNVENILLH